MHIAEGAGTESVRGGTVCDTSVSLTQNLVIISVMKYKSRISWTASCTVTRIRRRLFGK